ncbi:peptidoglycan-binding protein [Saccharomonospora sp. CUA-673]|uniref:peptidoglycan-binding domain-containing protein n=1 Tax=Saccharomonospora sp. CUA-673 TaxID=1904969 RepID=UPI001115433A|nr:peptidoglycan-binding domain-containing protein [Saccharomonospora sp. CUA-673]
MLLTSVTTALVMLAGLLVLAPWENTEGGGAAQDGAAQGGAAEDDGTLDEPPHPQFGEYTFEPGARHECDVDRDADDDLLYAGYSRSRTDLVLPDTQGWTVVEIQCLLEHHDIAPGAVDGQYSWATDRSVRRLQDQAHIAVDGIVGPDTWRVLRGQEEP